MLFMSIQQSPSPSSSKAGYVSYIHAKHRGASVVSSTSGEVYICPNDLWLKKNKKKKHKGDEENSCGRPWNTRKTVSPPFFFFPSTKYGLQCDRMTDKLFGNLFGSSSWLAVLLVVGSQRRQW